MKREKKLPNPGSPMAVKKGCKCPTMDNEKGKGYMGVKGVFVYSAECPVHKHLLDLMQMPEERKFPESKESEPILVWPFETAPKKYKELSTNGGDEDWVVFVPPSVTMDYAPTWLENIDTCLTPDRHEVEDGTVWIGSHA